MKYDVLFALAPNAPQELLHKVAAALEETPAPDVLIAISEALHEAATFQECQAQTSARDIRELAIVIAAGVTEVRTPPRRPASLIEDLRSALSGLLDAVPSKNFRRDTREGNAWLRALAVKDRCTAELGHA